MHKPYNFINDDSQDDFEWYELVMRLRYDYVRERLEWLDRLDRLNESENRYANMAKDGITPEMIEANEECIAHADKFCAELSDLQSDDYPTPDYDPYEAAGESHFGLPGGGSL